MILNNSKKARRYRSMYMNIAHEVSNMSYAKRLKVGSVIVKDRRILSMGWNGMPSGFPNECEKTLPEDNREERKIDIKLVTKPEVLHAESNALTKLAQSTDSSKDAVLFTTIAPCMNCAKLIHQSGIRAVLYESPYRSIEGIEFLVEAGCSIWQQSIDGRLIEPHGKAHLRS